MIQQLMFLRIRSAASTIMDVLILIEKLYAPEDITCVFAEKYNLDSRS